MNNELITPPKSWWSRNWPWVVPVGGCLTVIIAVVVLFGSLLFGAMNMVNDSDVVQQALEKINNDELATATFGKPIEVSSNGGNYSYMTKNGVKTAKIKCRIYGPKADGYLTLDAIKLKDSWQYKVLKISTDEDEINLAEPTWDDPNTLE